MIFALKILGALLALGLGVWLGLPGRYSQPIEEIEEAMEDLTGLADEGLTWRLSRAAEARHRAERSQLDEISEQGEDRAAMSAELQRLIDGAAWIKKKP